MKIIEENQTTFILKDDASKAFVFGGFGSIIALGAVAFSVYAGISNKAGFDESMFGVFGIEGFVLVVCLAVLLFARVRTTIIDKSQDSLRLVASGLLGKRITGKKISDVARVELRTQIVPGDKGALHENYRLAIVSKDGTELMLDSTHDQKLSVITFAANVSGIAGIGREREMGQKIASFIGVAFNDGDSVIAGTQQGASVLQ